MSKQSVLVQLEPSEGGGTFALPALQLMRLGGGKVDTNAASGEQDELDNGVRFD